MIVGKAFQSTRPVRGATYFKQSQSEFAKVSIHAPRAGRDPRISCWRCVGRCFNPRAPCGARHTGYMVYYLAAKFQSTRPVRGATQQEAQQRKAAQFQSTRPVRGATPLSASPCSACVFQSTRPVRGATESTGRPVLYTDVSIHAPRAGRDTKKVTTSLFCHIFMGLTRHEYGLLGAYVPHISFDVVHAPIFLHFIFCLLHLRTPKST